MDSAAAQNTIMFQPQQKMQKATLKCISFFSFDKTFWKKRKLKNIGYIEMSKPKVRYDKDTSKKVFSKFISDEKRAIFKNVWNIPSNSFFLSNCCFFSENVVKVFIISKAPNPRNKSAIKIFDGSMKSVSRSFALLFTNHSDRVVYQETKLCWFSF